MRRSQCSAAVAAVLLVASALSVPVELQLEPSLEAAGTAPQLVWVFFAPRPIGPAERAPAIAEARAQLSEAALQRRARMAATALVDERDLPLHPEHLRLAQSTGARLRARSRWLNAASFVATAEQIGDLRRLDCVRRIEPVRRALRDRPEASPLQPSPARGKRWSIDYGLSQAGLEMMNIPTLHELGLSGAGVRIGMLDSGFRLTHEAMDHVPVLAAYDVANDDGNVDTEPGDAPDQHSHGTLVFSTVAAYAPGELVGAAFGVTAILARVSDETILDPIEEDWWIAGLEWAEAQGADLISSSHGFWHFHDASDFDGNTSPATIAADLAAARGLLVVNGCGNQGGSEFDVIVSPADGDSVLAVGMTDVNGVLDLASSTGPTADGRTKPDVVAFGRTVPVVDAFDDFAYTTASGTSFSGPFVAGVAALMLERVPFLTPMQILEAFRETADRHDEPDNQYGWGMIDALAAVHYWGPKLTHQALSDREDTSGPYVVVVDASSPFSLGPDAVQLHYRVDAGSWQSSSMQPQGDDRFAAGIPGQPLDSTIEYYVEAIDAQGLSLREPLLAPASTHAFEVFEDTIAPLLQHTPLAAQPLGAWPPAIVALASDNFGLESVTLSFDVNGGPTSGPHALVKGLDGVYGLEFPLAAGALTAGDVVHYQLLATDRSQAANSTQLGPFSFSLLAGNGTIQVIDYAAGRGEAAAVAAWLGAAGYSVSSSGAAITAGDLAGKQAVVVLCGNNATPVASAPFRNVIRNWVLGGGRLLIEGGEVGYVSLVAPGYATFANTVLHATAWNTDLAGPLVPHAGQAQHDLLQHPQAVATPLVLNAPTETDQDAMSPAADAQLLLTNSDRPGTAGALVYDDNPLDRAVQVVYFPFALGALVDQAQAQNLVLNAVSLLLDTRLPTVTDELPSARGLRLSVAPNPFNASASITFELARPEQVRVEIYSLRGQLVCVLLDELRAAGPQALQWRGEDGEGAALASGVYAVRVRAGGRSEELKVALVK